MTEKRESFYIPTRPYSPIDALNRRASACGSPRYAMMTSNADYNGHALSVTWNDYRGYWITEYYFGERVVLARGAFADCLRAAVREFERGALGCSVHVSIPSEHPDAPEAVKACWDAGLVAGTKDPMAWYTWRHTVAASSVRDYCFPGQIKIRFDWELLQAAENEEAYKAALKAKYGNWVN